MRCGRRRSHATGGLATRTCFRSFSAFCMCRYSLVPVPGSGKQRRKKLLSRCLRAPSSARPCAECEKPFNCSAGASSVQALVQVRLLGAPPDSGKALLLDTIGEAATRLGEFLRACLDLGSERGGRRETGCTNCDRSTGRAATLRRLVLSVSLLLQRLGCSVQSHEVVKRASRRRGQYGRILAAAVNIVDVRLRVARERIVHGDAQV